MALAADEGISKTNTVSRVWKEELYNVDNVWEPYEGLDFNVLFGKVSFKTLLTLLFKKDRYSRNENSGKRRPLRSLRSSKKD